MEVVGHMILLGEPGPVFKPRWPDPVDPRLDIGPLDTSPMDNLAVEANVEVADRLGAATEPETARSHRSWMGVSTNSELYSDDVILESAKWAVANTAGFTLVVSDELNRYNWVAETGEWEAYDQGNHIRSLKRGANKRALEARELFDEHSIIAGVVLWSRMHRKIVEESRENDITGMMMHGNEWRHLNDVAQEPPFSDDLVDIHRRLAPQVIARSLQNGNPAELVDRAMSGYSLEEIFMTTLLAKTGWANIKIGPEWERPYDEITANYLAGNYDGQPSGIPFGAVYLRPRYYTSEKYKNLVEHNQDPRFRAYMMAEQNLLGAIPEARQRTFVDIGAGNGRLTPVLAETGRNVIAIEVNTKMYAGLEDTSRQFENVTCVQADALALSSLLAAEDVDHPVFVIAQNTLGTWEGDYRALLDAIIPIAREKEGELVLSLLRQPALEEWGQEFYIGMPGIAGEADPGRTNFNTGQFVAKNGYRSKWWTDDEIEDFKALGEVIDETHDAEYYILRIKL